MSELSPERTGRITASRIATVLGYNPYAKRADVLREMVRQYHGLPDEFTGNEATEYGHQHEPKAIALYEQERQVFVHSGQQIAIHPFYDFLAATPDGFVDDDGLIEVKCPYRARYEVIEQRRDYEVQIRLQLECTQRRWCDFVVWRPRGITISRVHYDGSWLGKVLPRLEAFMAEYYLAIADPAVLAAERARGVTRELSKREQFLADRDRWRELQQLETATLAELGEIKVRVGEAIGDDAEIGTLDGVPVAKWQHRAGSEKFDRPAFKKDHPDLEADYTVTGEATRYPVLLNEGESA